MDANAMVDDHVLIIRHKDGFRRCGMAHAAGPTVYDPGRWTEGELARFEADATFTVTRGDVEASSDGNDGSGKGGEKKPEPSDPAARQAAITAAIGLLDSNHEANWTKSGQPDATALTEIVGWQVSAKERSEAWKAMNETGDDAGN